MPTRRLGLMRVEHKKMKLAAAGWGILLGALLGAGSAAATNWKSGRKTNFPMLQKIRNWYQNPRGENLLRSIQQLYRKPLMGTPYEKLTGEATTKARMRDLREVLIPEVVRQASARGMAGALVPGQGTDLIARLTANTLLQARAEQEALERERAQAAMQGRQAGLGFGLQYGAGEQAADFAKAGLAQEHRLREFQHAEQQRALRNALLGKILGGAGRGAMIGAGIGGTMGSSSSTLGLSSPAYSAATGAGSIGTRLAGMTPGFGLAAPAAAGYGVGGTLGGFAASPIWSTGLKTAGGGLLSRLGRGLNKWSRRSYW